MKGNTKNIINKKRGFLGNVPDPLTKLGLPLMKIVLTPLPESAMTPLGLTAAVSATDAATQQNIHGSGIITVIISNNEMRDIMKLVNSLEEADLLIKCVVETIENKVKQQKCGFLGMLL